MQETCIRYLGWEDPIEKGMAIYSSLLAWRIPWTEEPGGLQSVGSQRVGCDWATNTTTTTTTVNLSMHILKFFFCFVICFYQFDVTVVEIRKIGEEFSFLPFCTLTFLKLSFFIRIIFYLSLRACVTIKIVIKPNSSQLSWCAAKLIYWYLVVVKEITAFIAGCQARRTGSSCHKDPTSWWLSGKGIVQATLEVSQGLTWSAHGHSSLVGDEMSKWWFKNLNHHPPDSSQSGVCLLCCGHHTVNILHWVGIIASVK